MSEEERESKSPGGVPSGHLDQQLMPSSVSPPLGKTRDWKTIALVLVSCAAALLLVSTVVLSVVVAKDNSRSIRDWWANSRNNGQSPLQRLRGLRQRGENFERFRRWRERKENKEEPDSSSPTTPESSAPSPS